MPVIIDIDKVPERTLQKAVIRIMSDPLRVWKTGSGKELQILSSGRLNVSRGPDFKDTAVLLRGIIIVGDCEFHRSLSDWDSHRHSLNPDFDNVILHIVVYGKSKKKYHHEILVISEEEMIAELKLLYAAPAPKSDMASIEDLQHYALNRLLGNADKARNLLNNMSVRELLNSSVSDFIMRYSAKKRRPVYSDMQLRGIIDVLSKSRFYNFLFNLKAGKATNAGNELLHLQNSKIPGLGSNLKKEIVHNCILPIALCLARERSRIELFEWYWSSKALNVYGILSRNFPELPQDYIWQQQGMLEYLSRYGRKRQAGVSEILAEYVSFAAQQDSSANRLPSYSRRRSNLKRYS